MAGFDSNIDTVLERIERIRNLEGCKHLLNESDLKTIKKALLKNSNEVKHCIKGTEKKSSFLNGIHKKEEDDDFEVLISPSQANVVFSLAKSSEKKASTMEKEEQEIVQMIEDKNNFKASEELFPSKENMMAHTKTTSKDLEREVLLKDATKEYGEEKTREEIEKENESPSQEDDKNELKRDFESVKKKLIEPENKKESLEAQSLELYYFAIANENETCQRTIKALMNNLDESHLLMQQMIDKIKLLQREKNFRLFQ